MKRILAAFLLAFLAAASAPAQKLYVADFSGPVEIVRANGNLVGTARTRNTLKLLTAVTYGDVIVTGSRGRITLSLPGTLSVSIPENSVVGYFFAGPGTDPRPFLSIVAGNADISLSAGAARALPIRDDRFTADSANGALAQLERCAAKLETVYAELEKLGADCDAATAKLEAATDEYRTLLAAAGGTSLQVFRETQLYPAEDARSSLIREIQYRTILARTIRHHILAPLYMAVKTGNPEQDARDADTAPFFEKYAAVINRYEEVLFK
jgi:hypothetical protein